MASHRASMVNMSIRDSLYMHPLEKYERFGIYPWKIVIQILLLITTTCQVLIIVFNSASYSYTQYTLWNKLFLNPDVQGSDTTITNSYNVFSIKDLSHFLQKTVDIYYHINSHTLDNYSYEHEDDGSIQKPRLLVDYLDYDDAKEKGYEMEYKLSPEDLGPFSHLNPKNYLELVSRFEVKMIFNQHLDDELDLFSTCYHWEINQKFDYSVHGPINVVMDIDRSSCGDEIYDPMKKYVWLGVAILILSICSLCSIFVYFMKRAHLIAKMRGGPRGYRSAWDYLGTREKLKFLNLWVIFNIIGNICQMFSGILTIVDQGRSMNLHETLIGFGCFTAWVGIIQYLEHTSQTYTIANTLKRSFSTLLPYMVGILPIFMGFTFLAMCLFWNCGFYPNTTSSMVALFALLCGDSVYFFFDGVVLEDIVIGQIYMFAFIIFFINCVHNLFVAIIQEGFNSLKEKPVKKIDESESEEDETEEIETLEEQKEESEPEEPADTSFKRISTAPIESSPKIGKRISGKIEEQQKISKLAFKQILEGRIRSQDMEPVEKNTKKRMDKMNKIAKEIAELKKGILFLSKPSINERGIDRKKLQNHAKNLLEIQLPGSAAMLYIGED